MTTKLSALGLGIGLLAWPAAAAAVCQARVVGNTFVISGCDAVVVQSGDVKVSSGNLVVQNGTNNTATANGKGNVVIGYNATRGPHKDKRGGSHNLVVGDKQNYASYGGIVGGYQNEISGKYATAAAGAESTASGLAERRVGNRLVRQRRRAPLRDRRIRLARRGPFSGQVIGRA